MESPLRLIKRSAEFRPIDCVKLVPRQRRGLYVLYRGCEVDGRKHFNVVYVGMARKGMRGRLESHCKTKKGEWTHFSVFEVWENIRDEEIAELEGLFRHVYRKDSQANRLAVQKTFNRAVKVRQNNLKDWR